ATPARTARQSRVPVRSGPAAVRPRARPPAPGRAGTGCGSTRNGRWAAWESSGGSGGFGGVAGRRVLARVRPGRGGGPSPAAPRTGAGCRRPCPSAPRGTSPPGPVAAVPAGTACSHRGREAVAGAAHRLHHAVEAGRLQGLAQAPDVHVDRALLDIDAATPDVVEQLGAAVDA